MAVTDNVVDKYWMGADRNTQTFIKGVDAFLEYAVSNYKNVHNTNSQKHSQQTILIPCPCIRCVNHLPHSVEVVRDHLFTSGIDETYTNWTYHGEKEFEPLPYVVDEDFPMDTFFVDDSMDYTSEKPTDAAETIDLVGATGENFMDDPIKFRDLLEDAEKPLYEGCHSFTKLSAVIQLLNLKSKYGVSDKFYNELLPLLKRMLPEGNEMYPSTYEAKKAFKQMGSGYEKIHACANRCILYRKEFEHLTTCPTCGNSRWKVDVQKNKIYENVPANVLWYFPIIPRMKRLFQSMTTAQHLRWHSTERKVEAGVMRHPADSPAWAAIDDKYPEFGNEPRNLRLGISADGVDVNSGTKHHSVWPVLAVIYNLPPWLCMKRKFIMLSLLISGSPGKDIDVFLAPLVDDLQILFDQGVETYDAYSQERFTLRAAVLWTINDYPALGTLSGCPNSGYRGCTVCGEQTHCIRLPESSKQCYAGHRRYLPYDHPFRKQKKAFDGKQEFSIAPEPLNGEQIYNKVKFFINKWGKESIGTDPEAHPTSTGRGGKIVRGKRKNNQDESSNDSQKKDSYWKKFNIWYRRLRYWRHNSIQHCIDFMHIEKNVAESIIGTLLNVPHKTKDGHKARLDLVHYNLKPELHPRKEGNKTTLPAAGCTLTKEEKDSFCHTLYHMRVPQGYCSNFSTLVNLKENKLIGLKSHDYHMLMQEFLPVAIRSMKHTPTRLAITRFCFFFKAICSKEIKVAELDRLQEDLIVTLCLLEKHFPPAFFDVMIHLTVHLTREVKLCGPICFRWMYPFERCMKVIKGHVRNRNRPEGCIAEENVAEETIEFFSEFLKSMETVGIPHDIHNTYGIDEANEDTIAPTDGRPITAPRSEEICPHLFEKAHFFVLQNTAEMEPYIK